MKNQKLSVAIERDLKASIKAGQKEIREGFRIGKEPDWKSVEADMKSQLSLNPNTYQKHVDFADKRHIKYCGVAGIEPKIVPHNYDEYDSFYKKGAGKYVIKNNIERMKSLWKKNKDKTSTERVAYYQKVKGVWDRRNRRSSKFITSRITEDVSRENIEGSSGYVDLLNLGPKPCLECIALRGIHKAETAPHLPIHAGCYCEYRPGAKTKKKAAVSESIKTAPITISKEGIHKGLEGKVIKIDSNVALTREEDDILRSIQLRLNPNFARKRYLMQDLSQKNFFRVAKSQAEAHVFMGQPAQGGAGYTYISSDGFNKVVIIKGQNKWASVHEIGHVVASKFDSNTRNAAYGLWKTKVAKGGPVISKYSLTNDEEYFAESFRAYKQSPGKLMEVDKKMYNLIKNDIYDGFEWT
jgi:hypothetical protein